MRKNCLVEYMNELANRGWYVDHVSVTHVDGFPELDMAQFAYVNDDQPEYRLMITGCHRGGTLINLYKYGKKIVHCEM